MSAPGEPPPPNAEILIVEDSLTQALKLQRILEMRQYRVRVARNGREALDSLAAGPLPSLIITDINMPEMDGYELCRRIKDDPHWRELPVILLTSLSDPKDILNGLDSGADNFIVKPYDEAFLLSRIQYVLINLELRRQSRGKQATEIFFAGQKYHLTSDRTHSIDLLLSTYETAVQKNNELSQAKETLEAQAEELRQKNAQMQADLDMARELQSAFLPKTAPVFPRGAAPEESAIRFCHRYITTTDLGGDFFDILRLSDTQAGVFICDVMGHGVRAALVTAIVRGLVEELKAVATDPGRFLTEINQSLCAILKQTLTPLFASAFYVVADIACGEMRFANAGHPAPFHIHRDLGTVEPLTGDAKPGPALGIFADALYRASSHPLAERDLVMLYTDGLYEVEGPGEAFYDKEQLFAAVARRIDEPAPQLFDGLIEEIKSFALLKDFDDDVCLVGLEATRLLTG